MLIQSNKEKVLNEGWVQVYRLKDYDKSVDDNEILKIVASTIYQKDSDSFNDIGKTKLRLMNEGALNTPSRVLEFIPEILDIDLLNRKVYDSLFKLSKYSYVEELYDKLDNGCVTFNDKYTLYTNRRNIAKNLNNHVLYDIHNNKNINNYEKFVIVKMFIPMFIRDQFMTHTQLSKLNRSYRVSSQKDNKYWFPEDFRNRFKDKIAEIDNHDLFDENFNNNTNINLMKDIGYPKEVWARYGTQARYGEMCMAGWLNDPDSWQNFFLERGCIPDKWNNWVQKETKEVSNVIYNLIMKG